MKRIFLLLTLFIGLQVANAQYVTIPDSNFRNALKALYPTCFNASNQMDTTCNNVLTATNLTVSNKGIASLQGIEYFKALRQLNCSNNQLTTIPTLSKVLTTLNCFGNRITSLPALPNTLTSLTCYYNKLTSLPALPNLLSLSCENNLLTVLPVLPNTISTLSCYNNKLTVLPVLPSSLINLNCWHNQLTALPVLPNLMTDLSCYENQITSLPVLPDSLKNFNCSNNPISCLPAIPFKITYLNTGSTYVSCLPNAVNASANISPSRPVCTVACTPLADTFVYVPDSNFRRCLTTLYPGCLKQDSLNIHHTSIYFGTQLSAYGYNISNLEGVQYFRRLTHLYCSNNRIVSFPALPASLTNFDCRSNGLTILPNLPVLLSDLNCGGNQLTTLGTLPNALQFLDCSRNQLTSLPSLPNKLLGLYCSNNHLISLPSLPDTLRGLDVSRNPLSCLPLLPYNIRYIDLSGDTGRTNSTNVTCLPNQVQPACSIYPSVSVCTSTSGACDVNPLVQGKIYNDINNNGIYNTGEQLVSQQIVKVLPNNWLGASDVSGNYVVKLDTIISNSWSAINNYRYATITPASYTLANIHNLGLQSGSYDFGVHFIANVKDLETVLGSSPARPGFTTNVSVTANNVGTVNQSSVTIKLKKPTSFNVLSTSIAPTSTSNDTLIWKNISINYLEHQSIYIQLQVPVSVVLGDSAVYEAWSNGTQGDSTPLDNYTRWTEVIRGSYDPNDKTVNKTSLPPSYNADKDKLLYTIRFQNTGTDTAFTVIVRDEIPNNLDVSSLRVVNASHKYQLIVREKNIVEVAFPNIQLPDSNTNEAKSHGFVQLEFKPKAGLPVNAEINNSASIYFDYNLPVITNTATTKIQLILGTASNRKLNFKLFPNPTSSSIKIELPYNGNGNWYLTDISGNSINQNSIENNTDAFDINVADVASGTYLLTLEMNGTVSTSKVVIVR